MAKKEASVNDALRKVALGYQVAEITEEYAEVDGEMKLTKRKRTQKDIPPDLKAVQLLLASEGGDEYKGWSDEELERERTRLLAALQESGKSVSASKAVKKKAGKSEIKKKTTTKKVVKKAVKK